jgi:hypothetical protein
MVRWIGKHLEGSFHGLLKLLSQHLLGGTEGEIRCPGWDSNRTSSEYKYRAIPLRQLGLCFGWCQPPAHACYCLVQDLTRIVWNCSRRNIFHENRSIFKRKFMLLRMLSTHGLIEAISAWKLCFVSYIISRSQTFRAFNLKEQKFEDIWWKNSLRNMCAFFNWPNPSSRTVALGWAQPLTEMSTSNLPEW